MTEPWLGTKDAAAVMGVSVSTIQKMVEMGKLRAWRTQGGHRRIAQTDVDALRRSNQSPAKIDASRCLSVLIVEDNATLLKAYAKVAERWGPSVRVSFAGDAAAALLAIAQRRPDVVITDLVMAPFDGFHLIRTLRAAPDLAATRILVVTGLSDEEIGAHGGLDELTLVHHKPLSYDRLTGYIEARAQDLRHQRG